MSIQIRRREHIPYIKTNNHIPAYTLHILNNRHEYGSLEQYHTIIKSMRKRTGNELLGIILHTSATQWNLLIDEQKTNEPNPIYALVNTTKHVTQLDKHSDSERTGQARQEHQHTGESIIKQIYFTYQGYNTYTFTTKVHVYNTMYIRPPNR